MIGYYDLGRRSKKWWKRVLTYVVECCIFNAFVLKQQHNNNILFLEVKRRGLQNQFHLKTQLRDTINDTI